MPGGDRVLGGERADPPAFRPMLAVGVEAVPHGPDWAFEVKWDGIRAIVTLYRSSVGIAGRSGRALVGRFPELADLADQLGDTEVVLDGEIVAFDGAGLPSFELLQRRMHLSDTKAARRAVGRDEIVFLAFDLLWLAGEATTGLPYRTRRRLLERLGLQGSSWRTPPG